MANLSAARAITQRGNNRTVPVTLADGYTFYVGGVLSISTVDGYARPATATNDGTIVAGLLAPKYGNWLGGGKIVTVSGTTLPSDVIIGIVDLDNDATITQAQIGSTIYLQTDHSVGTTSTSGLAVKCIAVNSDSSVQVALEFAGQVM